MEGGYTSGLRWAAAVTHSLSETGLRIAQKGTCLRKADLNPEPASSFFTIKRNSRERRPTMMLVWDSAFASSTPSSSPA